MTGVSLCAASRRLLYLGVFVAHRIGLIGGDGIGPEVVEEAMKVVRATGIEVQETNYELGAAHYLKTGEVLSQEVLKDLSSQDAILLGAVGPAIGSNEVTPGLLERGLLLKLRFELDLYINLRPFSRLPDVDIAVVRENTEGPYVGEGGVLRKGTPYEIATQGSVNTRFGVERCIRFAFELANKRDKKHLTLVHKTNVLSFSGDLWQRTFNEVKDEFPNVSTGYQHVDAACIYLVEKPQNYDVIVTDNLFGDILTDLAGALTGGIGLAASANLNPTGSGPSLFEPVHGAAHDIVGTGAANPLAAIISAEMMLEFLKEDFAAERVKKAVKEVISSGFVGLSTSEIGDAVAERV